MSIHLATTPEEQKEWMEQWRNAEAGLFEQKRAELRALTDEQALLDADMLLDGVQGFYRPQPSRDSSGMVEQQGYFARLRAQ